ncbi:MAG TPA: NUDIX domain-containing protein [Anaerolineales bacterium]|nr:NUDIX domain-containing protein [Anaerolineales bacterium]
MSLAGQRLDTDRYTVVPRTLVFLTRPGEVLLQRVPPGRGPWGGLYNGLGGHIERGEDPLRSAQREVEEESGLRAEALRLRGVVLVDTKQSVGIGLYVFTGGATSGPLQSGPEGTLEWVGTDQVASLPLVQDLTILLPRVLAPSGPPFSAVYTYDDEGELTVRFAS